jgi:hypothetical protein
MGLKDRSGAKWLQLTRGRLVLKSKDGTTSEHDSLEGRIIGIDFRDNVYDGKTTRQIHLIFDDGDDQYQLAIAVGSGYGKQLILKLATADLLQPVEITPTFAEDGPRKNSGMFVSQFGQHLKQLWTRDNPGPLPPLKEVVVKGQTVWDDTEQCEFLEEYVTSQLVPQIKQGITVEPTDMPPAGGDTEATTELLKLISKTLKDVQPGDNSKLATIKARIEANKDKLGGDYPLALELWSGAVDRLKEDHTPF